MIEPIKCFRLYIAIKAHFTCKQYDAVKYNARVKFADSTRFDTRNDKTLFISLAREFNTTQEIASFFVANFAYGNTYPLENREQSLANYIKWQRNRQSLTKMFMDDVSYLQEIGLCYNDFVYIDTIPKIYAVFKSKKINIETLTMINQLEPFVDSWKQHVLLKPNCLLISKLASFINFDEQKIRSIYEEFKSETV